MVRSGRAGEHGRHGEGSGVRLPLQGGLPPVDAVAGAVVEIACDESGFSGTNLLDPATPVITHASVDLRVGEAVELITALRSGFRFSPNEFKSGQFLRGPGAGEALEWFLAALSGRAHVHLVDKEYFLVTRIVDLFLAEPSYAAGTRLTQDHRPAALALYRAGRSAGPRLGCLPRGLRRAGPDQAAASAGSPALERFFQARDALVRDGLGAPAEDVLDGLSRDPGVGRADQADRRRPVDPATAGADAAGAGRDRPVLERRTAAGAGDPRRAERPDGRPVEPPPAGTGRRRRTVGADEASPAGCRRWPGW